MQAGSSKQRYTITIDFTTEERLADRVATTLDIMLFTFRWMENVVVHPVQALELKSTKK
jgi:hypothetical protein